VVHEETNTEPEKPGRSLVAPVVGEGAGDREREFSGSLARLLKGLESEKLPAAQRVALKQALRSALEEHEEVQRVKSELREVTERLRRTEEDLSAGSEALVRQSAEAETRSAGLVHDLEGRDARYLASEHRLRLRTIYLWLAVVTVIAMAAAWFLVTARPALQQKTPDLQKRPAAEKLVIPFHEGESHQRDSVEAALDRLDRAMDGVPVMGVAGVLNEANRWLKDSGAPPCSVMFGEAKISLLVTRSKRGEGLLTESILRCAGAVEHVLR
jgi:hypothetical protein